MNLERRRFGVISLSGSIGFFLAIAPILDPYIIFEASGFTLKINDIFMLIYAFLVFINSSYFEHRTGFLCKWLAGFFIINIFGVLGSNTSIGGSLKNLAVWMIYAVCMQYIWKAKCRNSFLKWIKIFAFLAAIFVILQFVCGNIGIHVWNGRILGLSLSKYDGWAGYIDHNTGDIRPNAFFQEASYVGIYLSVAFAQVLKEGKYKLALLYAGAMLLTTSMVAIVMCISITAYTVLVSKSINLPSNVKRNIIIMVIIVIIAVIFIGQKNEMLSTSLAYIQKRFSHLDSDLSGQRMSSSKYRLLGYIYLFNECNVWQRIFGVGIAQYASFFNVYSYSNIWVTTLLNSGILGLVFLVYELLVLRKEIEINNRMFFLILILIFSCDYIWFNWYFFYILTACLTCDYDKLNEYDAC